MSSKLGKVVGIVVLLLALLVAGYYALLSLAQKKALEHVSAYLSSHDAEHFSYRRASFQAGEVILYGLSFDEHGFNTIDRVTVSYDPIEFLLDQKVKSATLLHPVITLESSEILGGSRLSYTDLPVDLLTIETGEINFLTKVFGGVIVNYEANIKRQSEGYILTANTCRSPSTEKLAFAQG